MEHTPTLESVRRDALALSPDDRELLALDLHDSMEKDPGYDEKWAAEIARRMEKVRNGTAVLYDDDEADAIMFGDDDDEL